MQDIVKNLIRECGCDPADFADITPDLTADPAEFLHASTVGQVISMLAKLDQLPHHWPITGGASADMAGVVWIDTAGGCFVGVPRPTVAPIPDPCTWFRVPADYVAAAAAEVLPYLTAQPAAGEVAT